MWGLHVRAPGSAAAGIVQYHHLSSLWRLTLHARTVRSYRYIRVAVVVEVARDQSAAVVLHNSL